MTLDYHRAAEHLINLLSVLDEERLIRLERRLAKAGKDDTAALLHKLRKTPDHHIELSSEPLSK